MLVLELCDGNLKNFMEQNKKSLPIETIKEIFSGLNKVFQFMIGMNIIHRDLKLENLLIKYKDNKKKKFIVKLGDYGICKFLNQGALSTGPKGTPETMAPEILLKKNEIYENSVDIFSLGVVLYQLSHNLKHPYGTAPEIIYFQNYEEDNYDITIDGSIKNKKFEDLLKKMLKLNPKNRLTWDEYFIHPFFK